MFRFRYGAKKVDKIGATYGTEAAATEPLEDADAVEEMDAREESDGLVGEDVSETNRADAVGNAKGGA